MFDFTDSVGSESPRGKHAPEWALCLSLNCQSLSETPVRIALTALTEIEIGRGPERALKREQGRLRLDLNDRWTSLVHARLVRGDDGWTVEDAGSKNGTHVNGHLVERAVLADGDVVECGGTFFVLRQAVGPIADLADAVGPTALLHTLSPALESELAVLPKIARARVPVLVRGDSGTGKEVVASAVHTLSGRAGPLVPVNCGAIPSNLIESELFGSRRGAFSGAEDRPGLVRNADRGTLFLDEVAELPMASQAALLRVLQGGAVMPLGAGAEVTVDVRVIAATNQNIEDLIADGRFRRDLYARLRGYEIHLPQLRARVEDLGLLIANLMTRLDPSGRTRRLSRAAARALFAHDWQFHVRELEQVLGAALAVASRAEIALEDLPAVVRSDEGRAERAERAEAAAGTPDPGQAALPALPAQPNQPAQNERQRLLALLETHSGNLSAVARALATSRSQVHRLLARHAIADAPFRRR